MDVIVAQSNIANESQPHMKHGRPISSKYKKPRTRKGVERKDNSNDDVETLKESHDVIDFYVLEELIHSRDLALYVIKKTDAF